MNEPAKPDKRFRMEDSFVRLEAPLDLTPEPEESDDHWERVEAACEKYIQGHRQGNSISIEDYAAQFPDFESDILEMLPTVLLLEMARTENMGRRKDGRVARDSENYQTLGDYKIVGELGRGGMGIVYDAYQASLDRNVALKVLPRRTLTEEQKQRFFAEASTVARLHHSNIVPVFTVGEDQGVCFYAMEKLSGQPLDQFVSVGKRETDDDAAIAQPMPQLTVAEVVDIGIQISGALEYAHQNGVIHRDVKPANLILCGDGRVWLTDFGLATRLEIGHEESSTSVSGTLRYVAPERFDGATDAPTGDIYSLGITLMELLTGKAAFSAHRRGELLKQIRANDYASIDRAVRKGARLGGLNPTHDLIKVLAKAVSLDPTKRYQSAQAFHQDLLSLSLGQPVSANRLGPLRRSLRWCSKNKALALTSTLAIVSLIALTTVASLAYFQTQKQLSEEQRLRSRANNASRVAHQAIDEIFQQLNIGTGLTNIDSNEVGVLQSQWNTHLLNQLTRFYEKLAANEDEQTVPLDPVETRRRVGLLYLRLGSYSQAVDAFKSALVHHSNRVFIGESENSHYAVAQRAQIINEMGLARRISGDARGAREEHNQALHLLKEWVEGHGNDLSHEAVQLNLVQFEIARTLYHLGHYTRPGMGPNSFPPINAITTERRGFRIPWPPMLRPGSAAPSTRVQLREAVKILESILPEDFHLAQFDQGEAVGGIDFLVSLDLPQQLHLMALCYRELTEDNRSNWNQRDATYHSRAISILKTLIQRYPNDPTYQYDLVRALAEMDTMNLGQDRDVLVEARQSLVEAIDMAQKLVDRYPTVSDFQMEMSHANNKLALVLRRLREIEKDQLAQAELATEIDKAYRKAYNHQLELIKGTPESGAYKAWAAIFALELADADWLRDRPDRRNRLVGKANDVIAEMSSDDRLQPSVIPILDKARRLSLLGIADPPSDQEN